MFRIVLLLTTSVFLFVSFPVHSEAPSKDIQSASEATSTDHRQLVSMPAQARDFMRQDMLDHLNALNEIIGYLAKNKLDAAADVAETRMGKSSMGKHRASGMGPGRFMPMEMRNIGWGMHDAATEFSQSAKQGDTKKAYVALQKVTNACVACHYNYRTR